LDVDAADRDYLQIWTKCKRECLTVVQMAAVTSALHGRADVTSLMLRNTGLDDASLRRLVSALDDSTSLQYINLNCNDITADGVQHVIALIRDHPRLDSLAYVSSQWRSVAPGHDLNSTLFHTNKQ